MLGKAGYGAGLRMDDIMSDDPIRTRNQIRAEKAYNCVANLDKKHIDEKDYRQLARGFPALVHTCGLVQAVAFVQAKEKETGKKYLKHLSEVMPIEPGSEPLADQSREADLIKYQQLTRDAMESAGWLKRYSEAMLKEA